MDSAEIIGRETEREILKRRYNSNENEFVVVYGRRRVGKSFLVNKYFEGMFDFYVTGLYQKSRDFQLSTFAIALAEYSGMDFPAPKDWLTAFSQLKEYLLKKSKEKRILIFIDEMPWLDTPKSDFLAAFEWFWNGWAAQQNNIMMIVCGSTTTWITKKLLKSKGGFFNRVTLRMLLKPFTLRETELYLKSKGVEFSRRDIAECYMVMGGIPFYLKQISPTISFNNNIDQMFFGTTPLLAGEFNALYSTLFKNPEPYMKIVEALSKKNLGLTRNEIITASKLPDNGVFTRLLDDLCASGIVSAYNFFGSVKKNTIYQLCDFYTLFYFRFIKGQNGRADNFWTLAIDNPSRRAWAGYTFELLCKYHIPQLRKAIGISDVQTECSTWFYKEKKDRGCQIDLVILRRDNVINLCEMKFSSGEYAISADDEANFRNKIETFRQATGTKKALHFTMVTTFGVKKNIHSGIVQKEVTLDEIFSV
ncbi:MAG: ATP-binding protein [Salinivirgaceae bacterium]|nr:ATP-binding protein [Salinivirgaceae bacterium]